MKSADINMQTQSASSSSKTTVGAMLREVPISREFPGVPIHETARELLCNCLAGALLKYNTRYVVRSLPAFAVKFGWHKISKSTAATAKLKNNGICPGCLVHVVSGMFCSGVADRRQPNLCMCMHNTHKRMGI